MRHIRAWALVLVTQMAARLAVVLGALANRGLRGTTVQAAKVTWLQQEGNTTESLAYVGTHTLHQNQNGPVLVVLVTLHGHETTETIHTNRANAAGSTRKSGCHTLAIASGIHANHAYVPLQTQQQARQDRQ